MRMQTARNLQNYSPRQLQVSDLKQVTTNFYMVTSFKKRGENGTIQLELDDGKPKMFRVATDNGSGAYFKCLRDALIHCATKRRMVQGAERLYLMDELDKQVQGYWQNHD